MRAWLRVAFLSVCLISFTGCGKTTDYSSMPVAEPAADPSKDPASLSPNAAKGGSASTVPGGAPPP